MTNKAWILYMDPYMEWNIIFYESWWILKI